ncbi:MAG: hypothetical protein KKE44_26005 [Proteobacteria bacterium]|nr:hypothetical protein [Pseudomonadota bacterium]MBU1586186.1 hypothetical protein [Pseudomonadota bacterium]MBU2627926.1 hypothetical protein [Pseudomonadota bacterium]
MKEFSNLKKGRPGRFKCKDGKVYFSKELERRILFFMTMGMLLAGIFVKLKSFWPSA